VVVACRLRVITLRACAGGVDKIWWGEEGEGEKEGEKEGDRGKRAPCYVLVLVSEWSWRRCGIPLKDEIWRGG
jgi:hypothetical protein